MKTIGTNGLDQWNGELATRQCAYRMLSVVIAAGVVLLTSLTGNAQTPPDSGQIVTPPSGIEKPGDVGKRAHTNVEIFVPKGGVGHLPPRSSPAGTEPSTRRSN